ncbi:hypothetical protein [Krasilnikovia sp. MM14-A1004]|uniref:hypothetical protein n=1 Tax=Krasilnikovia sp. MM14-A1004 TaxID=3373541 RepID=UPI00399D0D03
MTNPTGPNWSGQPEKNGWSHLATRQKVGVVAAVLLLILFCGLMVVGTVRY